MSSALFRTYHQRFKIYQPLLIRYKQLLIKKIIKENAEYNRVARKTMNRRCRIKILLQRTYQNQDQDPGGMYQVQENLL